MDGASEEFETTGDGFELLLLSSTKAVLLLLISPSAVKLLLTSA